MGMRKKKKKKGRIAEKQGTDSQKAGKHETEGLVPCHGSSGKERGNL